MIMSLKGKCNLRIIRGWDLHFHLASGGRGVAETWPLPPTQRSHPAALSCPHILLDVLSTSLLLTSEATPDRSSQHHILGTLAPFPPLSYLSIKDKARLFLAPRGQP